MAEPVESPRSGSPSSPSGELSLEEVGSAIRGEPRGVALARYQRRLALEQQETARRKLLREGYERAADDGRIP